MKPKLKTRTFSFRCTENQHDKINEMYHRECPIDIPTKTDWIILKLLNRLGKNR